MTSDVHLSIPPNNAINVCVTYNDKMLMLQSKTIASKTDQRFSLTLDPSTQDQSGSGS